MIVTFINDVNFEFFIFRNFIRYNMFIYLFLVIKFEWYAGHTPLPKKYNNKIK